MPERTCRICRTKRPQTELARWILVEGKLQPDPTGKAQSRGYYSCRTNPCNERMQKVIIKPKARKR